MQDYIWLLLTIGFACLLQGIKLYDEKEYKSRWELVRKLIYGMGGSAFVVLIIYDCCKLYGMTETASLAIGGACGYIGAESFVNLLYKFLDKKV